MNHVAAIMANFEQRACDSARVLKILINRDDGDAIYHFDHYEPLQDGVAIYCDLPGGACVNLAINIQSGGWLKPLTDEAVFHTNDGVRGRLFFGLRRS